MEDFGTYDGGMDIPGDVIAQIEGYVASGRQVVLAFSSLPNFSERSGTNNFFSSGQYAHTATLGSDQDGAVQMQHTITRSLVEKSVGMTQLVNDLGGELQYQYAWDNIDEYRRLQAGVAFELSVCGEPGCLDEKSKNRYKIAPYAPLDGIWSLFPGASTKARKIAYPSVHIYVEKPEAPACGVNSMESTVDIPSVNILFQPDFLAAFTSVWLSQQPTISITAVEGNTVDSENISITINPNIIAGTGSFDLSSNPDTTAAIFLFTSPALKHATNIGIPLEGTNVAFSAYAGSLTITNWGTNIGDIISGSFSTQVSGVQITGKDIDEDFITSDHDGRISGSFSLEVIDTNTN